MKTASIYDMTAEKRKVKKEQKAWKYLRDMYGQKGSELKWEDAEPGVQRQVMGYDGQLMVVKVKFEKGAVGKAHSHYRLLKAIHLSVVEESRQAVHGRGDGT